MSKWARWAWARVGPYCNSSSGPPSNAFSCFETDVSRHGIRSNVASLPVSVRSSLCVAGPRRNNCYGRPVRAFRLVVVLWGLLVRWTGRARPVRRARRVRQRPTAGEPIYLRCDGGRMSGCVAGRGSFCFLFVVFESLRFLHVALRSLGLQSAG